MSDSLVDKIQQGEAMTALLRQELARGEKNPVGDNQTRLENNRKQIASLEAKVQGYREQQAKDTQAWNGLAGKVGQMTTLAATLKEWRIDGADQVQAGIAKMQEMAGRQHYAGAMEQFAELGKQARAPEEQLKKQQAAKEKFDHERPAVDERLKTASGTKFQADPLPRLIGQVDANLVSTDSQAKIFDYVQAHQMLDMNEPVLKSLETEVERLTGRDKTTQAGLAEVREGITKARELGFEELAKRIDAVETRAGQAEQSAAQADFNLADEVIGTLKHELTAIGTEAQNLEAKRAAEALERNRLYEEWQRCAPRLQALTAKVDELEEWKRPEAVAMRQAIAEMQTLGTPKNFVARDTGEDFKAAIDLLASTEQAIQKPYADLQPQIAASKTYEADRPPLDTRRKTAGESLFADQTVTAQLGDIDADLRWMTEQQTARDFVAANGRLSGVTGKLDKVEQALSELEIRAQVEAECGPMTTPEIEAEVKRRLYERERPEADARVKAANDSGVVGEEVRKYLDPVEAALAEGATAAGAGSFAIALDRVRLSQEGMGAVEDAVRQQLELRSRYDAAMKDAGPRAETLCKSEFAAIREAVEVITTDLDKARKTAGAHDYAKALEQVQSSGAGIDAGQATESRLAALDAKGDAAWTVAQPRLERAWGTPDPKGALKAGLATLQGQLDVIGKAAHTTFAPTSDWPGIGHEVPVDEAGFSAVITEIDKLGAMLTTFEAEAEAEAQRALYESAVESLGIEAALKAIRAAKDLYPELDESVAAVEVLDSARLELFKAGSFEQARAKVFELGTALDKAKVRQTEIETAFTQYKTAMEELHAPINTALAPLQPQPGWIAPDPDQVAAFETQRQKLADLMERLKKEVEQKRYLAAVAFIPELRAQLKATEEARLELTPFNQADAIAFINSSLTPVIHAHSLAASLAVTNFNSFVSGEVNSSRFKAGGVDWQKMTGYTLDVIGLHPAAKAVVAPLKIFINMSFDAYDNWEDAADKAAAARLGKQLVDMAEQVGGCFDLEYGSKMPASDPANFKKIGRLHALNKKDAALAVLAQVSGLRFDLPGGVIQKHFYDGVLGKFNAARRGAPPALEDGGGGARGAGGTGPGDDGGGGGGG